MTLHPDILTDLVILYHAGEASQATRELLETEAVTNPQVAQALAAPPRPPAPLPLEPPDTLRVALRDIRLLFRRRLYFATGAVVGLLALAFFVPQFLKPYPWLPFACLLVIWVVALFALRAHKRAGRRL